MMPLQGHLRIESLCHLAKVSRTGFYRQLRRQEPSQEQMQVRDAIQQIALAHRRQYGYRRVTAELRRRGQAVNHKRVAQLMRSDNLLALRKRKFVVTTDSKHQQQIFYNLARQIEPCGSNQLWLADITYIRLRQQFVYLAVILDAYSRRVVAWNLERHCRSQLAITALQRAIDERRPAPGVVHHSDRGIQYACPDYLRILRQHQFIPSMSRAGCPYDNAACESFMSTLKREQIQASAYRDLEELTAQIEQFIEQYYNLERLHSALGYCTPEEFESQPTPVASAPGQSGKMSLFRHQEIYRSDVL
jgi:putative transposase